MNGKFLSAGGGSPFGGGGFPHCNSAGFECRDERLVMREEQIAKELAAGAGIDISAARRKVDENRTAAIDAINAISKGDQADIKTTMAALNLSPNLANTADLRAAMATNNGLLPDDPNDPANQNTFDQTQTGKLRISPELASYVDSLTGHGCQNGNLSCRTNNPGAMRYSSWMGAYGGYPCGQSNNTACFPDAVSGLAAKTDLVMRRIQSGCDTLYTILENCQYASSNVGNNSWLYAQVVGRITGDGPNGRIDPQNAEQVGRLVSAMAWYEGGRGIGFTSADLEKALKVAYKQDSLPAGDPNFIPGVRLASAVPGLNAGYSPSPFASLSPIPIGYSTNIGSPTGDYTQAPQTFQPAPTQQQQQISQTISQTSQGQSTSGQSSVAQQLIDAVRGGPATTSVSGTSNPPIATIIVQPHTILRGNSITASWSSVGMSSASPCQVFVNKVFLLGRGNEGSKRVATDPTTSATLTFTLRCTTQSGQIMERNTSATIR